MGRTRILLADDPTIGCAGLAKLLEAHYGITGIVEDGRALLKAAGESQARPRAPGHWHALVKWLGRGARTKEKDASSTADSPHHGVGSLHCRRGVRAGAAAYVLKTSPAAELLQAVRDAMRGVSYVSPQIGRALEDRFIRDPRALDRPSQLISRQREVLQMPAEVAP